MNQLITDNIVMLRACVAFLGEKEQANWWSSSFLSNTGAAFLSSVFPKTVGLAQVNGASAAAQVSHDDQIGIGDVYHLFRLPENIEQAILEHLANDASVLEFISSAETAQTSIKELSAGKSKQGVGPLLLDEQEIDQSMIGNMAAAYMCGFSVGEQVYPYYRSKV